LPWQLPAIGDERRPETACFCTRLGPEIDEDWQETVDELTARAGVVLPQAGESAGLAWEVRHALRRDAPERVILSLPLHAKHAEPSRQERYDAFRRRFGDAFPRPLPDAIGHWQFLYFDAEWTSRLLGERGTAPPAGESERARAAQAGGRVQDRLGATVGA
jgi:hypothetical protein